MVSKLIGFFKKNYFFKVRKLIFFKIDFISIYQAKWGVSPLLWPWFEWIIAQWLALVHGPASGRVFSVLRIGVLFLLSFVFLSVGRVA